ncbi:MAG TPA: serine/threonine-protein kinase [Polyangiaceae bacterium]
MTHRSVPRCSAQHPPEERCADELCRAGEIIDRYVLGRCLGRGGMGVVYEARHAKLGRRFAIKFLRSELSGRAEILGRFNREARAAGALESEHLVATVDLGHAPDGAPYIVMEYLEGQNLAELLEQTGALSVPRATSIVVQACRGILVAHRAGIVHRDLKPQNLFVCRRSDGTDQIKVLDFGIAKLDVFEPEDASIITCEGQLLGTPAYMAPEQARGVSELDERVDVYALGAILYELLSGARAHPGRLRNDVLYHVLTQPVAPLARLRPDLPAGLCDAVDRALRVNAEERTPRVAELAGQIEAYAQPLAGRARDSCADQETLVTDDAPATEIGSTAARLGSRRPTALALLLILMLPLGAWVFAEQGSSARGSSELNQSALASRQLVLLAGLGVINARANAQRMPACTPPAATAASDDPNAMPVRDTAFPRSARASSVRVSQNRPGPRSIAASSRDIAPPGSLADDIYKP